MSLSLEIIITYTYFQYVVAAAALEAETKLLSLRTSRFLEYKWSLLLLQDFLLRFLKNMLLE